MVLCWLMVLNATFNNNLVISWQPVLLVKETGENHRPVASHWQTFSHNVASSTWTRFELTTLVLIGTDFIGSCKSNYHTISTMTAPTNWVFLWISNLIFCVSLFHILSVKRLSYVYFAFPFVKRDDTCTLWNLKYEHQVYIKEKLM